MWQKRELLEELKTLVSEGTSTKSAGQLLTDKSQINVDEST